MRILHITRDFPPRSMGGLSTAVGGMAQASVAAGLSVAVISFDAWRPSKKLTRSHAQAPDVDAQGMAVQRIMSPAHLNAAQAFARHYQPHLLHVHDGMLWEFAVELQRELQDPPLIKSVHTLQRHMNRLRQITQPTKGLRQQEAALARSDAIIVPSHAAATVLIDDYPTVKNRLAVIPFGVQDTTPAQAAIATPFSARAQRILYVGRFADIKGTHDLFATLPRVLTEVPEATCTLIGGLPENRKAERRWLAQLDAHLPAAMQSRVQHLGWCSKADIATWYHRAAVLVIPSHFETFGFTAAEGMLHGCPIAATSAGALGTLCRHQHSALLSRVGDTVQLGQHITTLLTTPALASRLAIQAARDVRQEYCWEKRLPQLLSLYTCVVATR